jgi:hypothetical protein
MSTYLPDDDQEEMDMGDGEEEPVAEEEEPVEEEAEPEAEPEAESPSDTAETPGGHLIKEVAVTPGATNLPDETLFNDANESEPPSKKNRIE